MKFKYVWPVILVLILSGTLQAAQQRGALVLHKEPLFEYEERDSSDCDALYDVKAGGNVPDMRDFRKYFCEGRYTLTLKGKKGTTVTLFGQFNYKKGAGFMVIVKNDKRKIWLINLEDFPSGKWVNFKANRDTGAYQIYYKSVSRFSENISSIQWGMWWKGKNPK
ncbi:MAG: hypothetical protein O6704_06775 [Nitrospinae bacterium]|nr:hypothetical protein [Nitrospinota bacterium]